MSVQMHRLFEVLLQTTTVQPQASLAFSLAASPKLSDFLADLDPELSLDWSGKSFRGWPALREGVLARTGLLGQCALDDVLITAGAAEANYLVLRQLLQPGDEVIIEQPGWPQPWPLCQAIGAVLKPWQRHQARGWSLDLGELSELLSPRTRLIFLTNPNNPTGQVMGEAELKDVCRIAERVGAYVLVDEVYTGLEWTQPKAPSVAGLYGRGITTGSVSKALGLQGLRIGWLVSSDPKLVWDAVVLREDSSEIMNVMGEMIAEVALRPGRYEAAIGKARTEGLHNLKLLDRFIASQPALSWHRPQAGLIGLASLNLPLSADAFAARLLADPYRTFIIPGSAYGCPQHLRLGVGGGEAARIEEGLARLERCLADVAAV
jgi:hypothetical protein